MTESLRDRVRRAYADLRFIVEKDAKAQVSAPTVQLLRDLITKVKDSGANPDECDKLLGLMPPVSKGTPVNAGDALLVAGQLDKLVGD